MVLLLLSCSAPYGVPSIVPAPEPWGPGSGAPIPAIVLNEVQAANDSTIMAPDLSFPDWAELYNASGETIDLSRLELADAEGAAWRGSGTLGPGERLLLFSDLDLPFSIDADGDTLTLTYDGFDADSVDTGESASDTALARYPDGGEWASTARPTPGWTNGSDGGDSLDPSEPLFDPLVVNDIALWVSDEEWAKLVIDNYTEVEASLAFGPAFFGKVAFRKKSTVGSNRSLDQKAAFKIDLNQHEDHRLRGLEGLTLNNMVQDPTYIAEHLAYTVYRNAGVPAPRVGYARLSINGVDWGLYALVETVDDTFLERWYADPSGRLYEGAYGVDVQTDEIPYFEYDEGPEPDDRSDLQAVADALSAAPDDAGLAALEQLVDMDEFLMNMAVETLILHWDGYTTINNYRLYHDPTTNRFQIIPWGTDQTFISAWYGPYAGGGRLLTFCLANASCYARYGDALLDAADILEASELLQEITAVRAALAADIATDPRAEHSAETQESYVETTRQTIRTWPDSVRAAVP